MVALEALRAVGGRERERRVVAAQLGQARPARPRRRPRAPRGRRSRRPSPGARSRGRRGRPSSGSAACRRPRRRAASARTPAAGGQAPSGRAPGRAAAAARRRASSSPSSRGSSIGSGEVRAPGTAARSSSAATTAASSSRFVRARTARVEPSAGQVRIARATRTVSSAASGARTSRPAAARPGQDPLREPLPVVLHEPDRPLDDRPRAAVVRSRGRRAAARAARPPGRGRAARRPAASRRSTGRRRRRGRRRLAGAASSSASSQLGPVQVLGLVHEQRGSARPPAGEQAPRPRAGTSSARTSRSSKSTPPVARTAPLVGDERPGDRARRRVRRDLVRRDPQVELEPREREVQPPAVGLRRCPGTGRAARSSRSDQRLDGHAGVAQDLAAQRVERPDPHGPGRDAQRRERRVQPLRQLLRRPLVERDDRDRPGSARRRPPARRPGRPGSSSCREPAGATHSTGPGRRGRRRALVRARAARGARRRTGGGRWVMRRQGASRRLSAACPARRRCTARLPRAGGCDGPDGLNRVPFGRDLMPPPLGVRVAAAPSCWSRRGRARLRPRVPSPRRCPR